MHVEDQDVVLPVDHARIVPNDEQLHAMNSVIQEIPWNKARIAEDAGGQRAPAPRGFTDRDGVEYHDAVLVVDMEAQIEMRIGHQVAVLEFQHERSSDVNWVRWGSVDRPYACCAKTDLLIARRGGHIWPRAFSPGRKGGLEVAGDDLARRSLFEDLAMV